MTCLIHYSKLKLKNSKKLINVDIERHKKLIEAQDARRTLGETYLRIPQCDAKPDDFINGFKYHKQCYAYFDKATSDLKNRNVSNKNNKTEYFARPTRCKETDSSGCFPTYCMFFRKVEIRLSNDERETLTRVTTELTVLQISSKQPPLKTIKNCSIKLME